MSEQKQVSSVADFKAQRSKIVTLASGLNVEIRKLSRVDFLRAEVNWIQPASDQKPEEKRDGGASEKIATMTQYVLDHGVVSPKVCFGDEAETPEGQIHESWIGDEEIALVGEILAFSGIRYEVRQVVDNLVKNETSSAQ